jgi:hypothetical protein
LPPPPPPLAAAPAMHRTPFGATLLRNTRSIIEELKVTGWCIFGKRQSNVETHDSKQPEGQAGGLRARPQTQDGASNRADVSDAPGHVDVSCCA